MASLKKNKKNFSVKKLTQLSVLITIAVIIFVLEMQLPPLTPIPGIKMGLSNITTLVVMILFSRKDAFIVLMLRIIISSIFAGQMTAFIYSITGGLVSFCFMSLFTLFINKDKIWIISIFSAIGHNIGQIAVAILITSTWRIIFYLPILLISGIISGAFTGITAQLLLKKIQGAIKL